MQPKRKGDNTKKAAGMAKKAEVAAQKKVVEDRKSEAEEAKKWQQGAKDNSKANAAAAKAAEQERKKAEKAAMLKEEEASLPSKGGSGNKKTAVKKSRGLDLSGLDDPSSRKQLSALNASGIDNALDALSLASNTQNNLDRHPERRFKAAYTVFEERRLEEMKDDKSLRRQQKIELIRKEFEKSPDNPFNQASASYNTSRDEMAALRETEREKKESLLGAS